MRTFLPLSFHRPSTVFRVRCTHRFHDFAYRQFFFMRNIRRNLRLRDRWQNNNQSTQKSKGIPLVQVWPYRQAVPFSSIADTGISTKLGLEQKISSMFLGFSFGNTKNAVISKNVRRKCLSKQVRHSAPVSSNILDNETQRQELYESEENAERPSVALTLCLQTDLLLKDVVKSSTGVQEFQPLSDEL